jgi:DNA-binding NarL/FixJ family response regulator
MTAHGSEQIAMRALQRGAASYVRKQDSAERLIHTVDEVLALSNDGNLAGDR